MQDEHYMRQWNESHDAFSAGVSRMAAKFERRQDRGVALRHAHANRIFIAIVAGLLAGVAVSTVATTDAADAATATASRTGTAPILA